MISVLRIAHLRIAPQEGNSEVGNCEVHQKTFFLRLPLESFWKLSVLNLIGFHYINVQGGLELGVPLSDGPCYERRWTGFYINCFFGGGITMMILDDLCRLYKANSFC